MGEPAIAEVTTPDSDRQYKPGLALAPIPAAVLGDIVPSKTPTYDWCYGQVWTYVVEARKRHGLPKRHLEPEDLGVMATTLERMKTDELDGGIARQDIKYFADGGYKVYIDALVEQRAAKEMEGEPEPVGSIADRCD